MLLRRRRSLFLRFCKSETECPSKWKSEQILGGDEAWGKASFVELIIFIYQKFVELLETEFQRCRKTPLTVLQQREHETHYQFQWRGHHYEETL